MIDDYLSIKPNWVWGYIEMADWYDDERDLEHYDLEKAKMKQQGFIIIKRKMRLN